MKEDLKNVIKRVVSIVLFVTIQLYPIFVYTLKQSESISFILTSVLFILPFVVIVLLIRKKWLYCIITVITSIMSIVELTMVKIFGSFLLPGGIISTLWTNPQEASEFYDTNLHVVWHWIPIIILCIAACILFQKPNNYRLRYPAYIGLLILPVLFVTYKLTFYYDKSKGRGITLRYFMDNRVWSRPPYNICYSSIQMVLLKQ